MDTRNGGGRGILEGREHMEESGDQKQPLFLVTSRDLKKLLDPLRYPKLFQLGNSETCSTNSALSGTKAHCGKLPIVSLLFQEGSKGQGATEQPSSTALSGTCIGNTWHPENGCGDS